MIILRAHFPRSGNKVPALYNHLVKSEKYSVNDVISFWDWLMAVISMHCICYSLLFTKASSEISDSEVEPQPLWEYPCTACSDPVTVQSFEFSDKSWMDKSQSAEISIRLDKSQ